MTDGGVHAPITTLVTQEIISNFFNFKAVFEKQVPADIFSLNKR